MNRRSNLRLGFAMMGSVVGACFFSIIPLLALTKVLQHNWGIALVQLLNLLLLIWFVYLPLWRIGEKDINYVNTGHIKYDCYSGLKIGLIAMSVMYLPLILLIIGMIQKNQIFIAVYRIVNAVFFGIHSLFLPVMVEDFKIAHVLLTLIPPLLVPAISSLAYFLGYRRISLFTKLVYKTKK